MKKLLSLILVASIFVCISAPAYAKTSALQPIKVLSETYTSTTEDGVFTESYCYVDSIGDTYKVFFSKTQKKTTVVITDEIGTLVSKSEYLSGADFITNTTATLTRSGSSQEIQTENIDIDRYIVDNSEFDKVFFVRDLSATQRSTTVRSSGGDPVPNSTTFTHCGTFNTDLLYQGRILTGEGYYRMLPTYTEYNRNSYKFELNTALGAICTILSGVYSFLTGTDKILILAGGMGISFIGSALATDWNLNACVRSFDFQFQGRMLYNGSTIITGQITRQLEYLYGYDEIINRSSYAFDARYHTSPAQALRDYCSEAVGYGASAFLAKYVDCTYPTLVLPVSGPSWTWTW